MAQHQHTEVLIIGGSYAGLAAAMALGRARRRVIVLDSGRPCNRQTPHAHNFLTHDGEAPEAIRAQARAQVLAYPTVELLAGEAVAAQRQGAGFVVRTADGATIEAAKLVFATGVKDVLPPTPGFAEAWGISVLHCPYCHGYEVADQPLGVLGNGELGFDFARLIHHWSPQLTLFTNGPATLTEEQTQHLHHRGITIIEAEIQRLDHAAGYLRQVMLAGAPPVPLTALFARVPFELHCLLPVSLGCDLTAQGLLQVDEMQRTSVPGIFAAGDATTPMRSVAVAVAAGTKVGAFVNHELIHEQF
ncbi:NAD(P)/FAD-dependent oxidoreductase [Hymenobacter chitinivorans]|uniref:Thioredoxin reductase n=1 Tax=Hymenobacter chitinivorans DSM 11115 TaxID=1121954 RepID=A0A2M9BPA6_9BACT|nr:NAD(P)/FAD-dependent oxidoreductase [Hymenobacter chitinivorans]PJJ59799.1 thioredoxin reductase [Hymenobacter chitinivorans DSM 11115]